MEQRKAFSLLKCQAADRAILSNYSNHIQISDSRAIDPCRTATLSGCDGLTLAGCQVPTKATLSFVLLNWTKEKKCN